MAGRKKADLCSPRNWQASFSWEGKGEIRDGESTEDDPFAVELEAIATALAALKRPTAVTLQASPEFAEKAVRFLPSLMKPVRVLEPGSFRYWYKWVAIADAAIRHDLCIRTAAQYVDRVAVSQHDGYAYIGSTPPWADSLGNYRPLSPDERDDPAIAFRFDDPPQQEESSRPLANPERLAAIALAAEKARRGIKLLGNPIATEQRQTPTLPAKPIGPPARLTGDMCQCAACGRYFPTTRAFDAHREGTFKPFRRFCKSLISQAVAKPISGDLALPATTLAPLPLSC